MVREQIETYMTTELDWKNAVNYAEEKYFKIGLAEGKAEGLAEGEAKGKAEGKAERNVEIAKALKEKGVEIAIVCQATGLSEEQIKAL